MPKIVIREFDNTTSGLSAYTNFAVVVPGFVVTNTDSSVFDSNGVYECSSRGTFEEKITLFGATDYAVPAKAPRYAEGWTAPKELSKSEFTAQVKSGKLYSCTAHEVSEAIGECLNGSYSFRIATDNIDDYVFTDTEGEDLTPTLFIVLDSVGEDAKVQTHYGNQIAYELLNLGYTVLYKKMESVADLENPTWWEPLKDKSLYDFRYVISGLLGNPAGVNTCLTNLTTSTVDTNSAKFDSVDPLTAGRGDCIALIDVIGDGEEGYKGKVQDVAINKVLDYVYSKTSGSKYAAIFAPTVEYTEGSLHMLNSFNKNRTFPASFHYLACAAKSAEHYSEWYANAGYTRGVSNYTISSVGYKFGEAAVSMFQRRQKDAAKKIVRSINPIISWKGNYYLWGNRTAEDLSDPTAEKNDLVANHFLNIRQLCTTLKKQIYTTCRQLTFDPNSAVLWTNFCTAISPILDKMKADQGITNYEIIKVKSSKKAFLSAVVRIVPIEAVEDFEISIYLEDALNGTTTVAID